MSKASVSLVLFAWVKRIMPRGDNVNEVEVEMHGFENLVKELQSLGPKAEKAINRTISDFGQRAPGWVAQEVSKKYNIKKNEVNKYYVGPKNKGRARINGARMDKLSLVYKGRTLTAIHFGMTPKKPPRLTNKKVNVHIPGAGYRRFRKRAKVTVKATFIKGQQKKLSGKYDTPIFIQENPKKAGQYLPFQRTGRQVEATGKDELVSVRSLSVPQMITNEKVEGGLNEKINEGLRERLGHYIQQALR